LFFYNDYLILVVIGLTAIGDCRSGSPLSQMIR